MSFLSPKHARDEQVSDYQRRRTHSQRLILYHEMSAHCMSTKFNLRTIVHFCLGQALVLALIGCLSSAAVAQEFEAEIPRQSILVFFVHSMGIYTWGFAALYVVSWVFWIWAIVLLFRRGGTASWNVQSLLHEGNRRDAATF